MEEVVQVATKWENWHYKNTGLLFISIVVFFFLADTPFVKSAVFWIGSFGYLGAFLVGIMFVSIFTVAPASVVLFYLAKSLDPVGIALAAGTGGLVGDYLIFRYFKDRVFEELQPFFLNHGGKPVRKLFKTPYFAWLLPVLGALLIMSPFPDEVGLGILGVSKIKGWQFIGLLYILDCLGIFLIVLAARS